MDKDLGVSMYSAGQLKIPFHRYTFSSSGKTPYVFSAFTRKGRTPHQWLPAHNLKKILLSNAGWKAAGTAGFKVWRWRCLDIALSRAHSRRSKGDWAN